MYILGLDTTQAACSAAVFDTSKQSICGRTWREMPRGHAEALPEMVVKTLKQAGITFGDIGKLATTIGPGTFTGVRIGLSAARGFALALDLPLVGVGSLEAIAAGVESFQQKKILAAFDARREEVYAQTFVDGVTTREPQVMSTQEAAGLVTTSGFEVVGTANELLIAENPELVASRGSPLPDSAIVAAIASDRPAQDVVHPLYLRKADAKAQKPLLVTEPGKLELLPASPLHAEILGEIHRQGFSNPWTSECISESLSSPGTSGYLAVDKAQRDQPFGFVVFRDAANEREILTIAVRVDARRRRVASFLIDALLQNARENNFDKIFLDVSDNNSAAQALYCKSGFTQCGTRKNYYTENDGQKYDAILMQRSI